jgi:hypothetical protein
MEVIFAKIMPFMVALAAGSGTMNNIVKWAATIGGGLVALFLIINIVKEGFAYAKGQGNGSVLGIIGKVLFLILMIGIIFLAQNYEKLGNAAKDIGQKGVDIVQTEVNGALTGD